MQVFLNAVPALSLLLALIHCILCESKNAPETPHILRGYAPAPLPASQAERAHTAHSSTPTQAPSPSISTTGSDPVHVNGTLDPAQGHALLLLGVVTGPDPCNTASHRTLVCDQGTPFKRLLSLQLDYCTEGALLPSSAWLHLSSLKALSFEECPAKPFHVPRGLANSLESLSIIASLGRSVSDVMAPPLPGAWFGSFDNLIEISITDVQVNSSSLHAMIMNMKQLQRITISNANLRGFLPETWPSHRVSTLHLSNNELSGHIPSSLAELLHLESLDISFNNLKGELPQELGTLQNLQYISLASNKLSGQIPSLIQNLRSLVYIDLSNNQFTGSIPSFFTNMQNLRYIDMRGNSLEGVVPFTQSFLQGLNSCKLGGNPGLCYNKSVVVQSVAIVLQGVAPCATESAASNSPSPSPDLSYFNSEFDPFKGVPIQRGPNKAIILIALALSCTIGAILTASLLSKKCAPKA